MTLFITTPKRRLEMDDAYVAALALLIAFAVGKIVIYYQRFVFLSLKPVKLTN